MDLRSEYFVNRSIILLPPFCSLINLRTFVNFV